MQFINFYIEAKSICKNRKKAVSLHVFSRFSSQALTCTASHQNLRFMVYVCRKEHFNAAHRLYNPAWSKEKNEEVFGICSNEYYHGHNFELIVTVKGTPQADTGCVIDLKKLSKLIREDVIEKLDHRNINIEVDFMQGKIPSCEVLVMEIWNILAPKVSQIAYDKQAQLHCLQLFETKNNFVEYYG